MTTAGGRTVSLDASPLAAFPAASAARPVTALIGNPRPDSRTRTAAVRAARRAAGAAGLPDDVGVVELAHLRRGLLDDTPPPAVSEALEHVRSARLLVVASPTYKATYTGLLKAFLDLLPGGGLAGVTAVPLLVMASPRTRWRSRCTCARCCWNWARTRRCPDWPCPRTPCPRPTAPRPRTSSRWTTSSRPGPPAPPPPCAPPGPSARGPPRAAPWPPASGPPPRAPAARAPATRVGATRVSAVSAPG